MPAKGYVHAHHTPTYTRHSSITDHPFPFHESTGGGNAKKESGRAKKAANEDKKAAAAAAQAEAAEAARWDDPAGSRGKSAAEKKADKAAEAARKAEEKRRLEAEDDAALPTAPVKSANKGKGAPRSQPSNRAVRPASIPMPSFSASNLDDALDAMSLVNEKTDSASKAPQQARSRDTQRGGSRPLSRRIRRESCR